MTRRKDSTRMRHLRVMPGPQTVRSVLNERTNAGRMVRAVKRTEHLLALHYSSRDGQPLGLAPAGSASVTATVIRPAALSADRRAPPNHAPGNLEQTQIWEKLA